MRIGSGLFLLGIVTLTQFRELPSPWVSAILAVLVALSVRLSVFRLGLWYFSGLVWALLVSYYILSQKLEPELEGEEISVYGYVSSLPSVSEYYLQFDFSVLEIRDRYGNNRDNPGKIRLNWYRPYPLVVPGEKLKLVVKLKKPHGYMNPGGFDYEAWLFLQRIRATGYVRKNNTVSGTDNRHITYHSVRDYLRKKLQDNLPVSTTASLIPALTIGDRTGMNNQQWQVLVKTGTSHLLSISGLHIGLIAGFAFFMTRWIWPLWYRGACLIPAPRLASFISLIAAALYALLAGFTVPTQRALLMISAVIIFGFLYKRLSGGQIYAIALLAVLTIDPLAVLSGGFWLSFAAVLVILIVINNKLLLKRSRPVLIWQALRLQLYIDLALIPILVVLFNQIPLHSLVANIIAIPWVTLICIPIIIIAIPALLIHEPAGKFILQIGSNALDLLWHFLDYLASIELAQLTLAQPDFIAVAMAFAGVALLFMPVAIPGKWLGIVCLLPLLFPKPALLENAEFELTVLDVGQGLSAVVKTRNHLLLYDTGPGFSTGFNAGWSVILPYMRNTGASNVDMIVLSHGDSDHIGGLNDILKSLKVGRLLTSVPDKIEFKSVAKCMSGQKWSWDMVLFEILSPYEDENLSGNNASCVLKVSNNKHSVLLSGDIERRAENILLRRNIDALDVSVLIAPHHGSATSSGPEFIQATSPEYVIFPTGYRNRFGFPRPDVIDRYEKHGSTLLNTAHDGAISIQFRKNETSIVNVREKSLRYWHNNTGRLPRN